MNYNNIFAERFSELIKNNLKTYEEIARDLGLKSKGTISKYATGRTKNIDISFIMKVSGYFKVSPLWLLGFTDDKNYNLEETNKERNKPNKILKNISTEIEYVNEKNLMENKINKESKELSKYISVKMLENTMYPILIKNDIAIIKKQKHFENGDFVAIKINNNKLVIRKMWKNKENTILQAISPYHEPMIFDNEEMKSLPIEIIGVVKELKRKF